MTEHVLNLKTSKTKFNYTNRHKTRETTIQEVHQIRNDTQESKDNYQYNLKSNDRIKSERRARRLTKKQNSQRNQGSSAPARSRHDFHDTRTMPFKIPLFFLLLCLSLSSFSLSLSSRPPRWRWVWPERSL